MKTLDEVIKALSVCDDVECCYACPHSTDYNGCDVDWGYLTRDALYYLRNYRDTKETLALEKRNYAEAVKNCERAEAKYTQMILDMNRNDPLTWDELKTMEGKPVWVEFEKNGNHWFIITDIKSNGAVGRGMYGENAPLYKDRIGTDWQAFRKERK